MPKSWFCGRSNQLTNQLTKQIHRRPVPASYSLMATIGSTLTWIIDGCFAQPADQTSTYFLKIVERELTFFLIFSNLESVRFFSKHISLKYVSNIFLENKVIKKVWRLFCRGCLSNQKSVLTVISFQLCVICCCIYWIEFVSVCPFFPFWECISLFVEHKEQYVAFLFIPVFLFLVL